MVHVPMGPDEVYDDETAAELEGVLLVGDDFGGYCEAYNTTKDWEFGFVDDCGVFETHAPEFESFVGFLASRFGAQPPKE
ncbi:MAG: hypothetical protein AAGM22_12640 [Acidobacteriota bacterium]